MANSYEKELDFVGEQLAAEMASIDGERYLRDAEGIWRFADTGIAVPGARDLTLTERFQPKKVIGGDGEVERVLVSCLDIERAPDLLGWCLEAGTVIEGADGGAGEVLVPIRLWQEHDRIAGTLVDPARSGTPAERELAVAERRCREAERELERAASIRAGVLRRHDGELTRQEARAITGLSVGRIQQLIRPQGPTELEHEALRFLAGGNRSRAEIREFLADRPGAPKNLGDVLYGLVFRRGWVERNEDALSLSLEGRQALLDADAALIQQVQMEEGFD
jgi:hypothetical protein